MDWTRVVLAVTCLSLASAVTQASETPPDAKQKAEAFLEAVAAGNVDPAVDALAKGSLLESQVKQLESLKGQIKTGIGLYGKYLGVEFLSQEDHGKSVVALTYLMKFEQNALVWNFIFYRPYDQWLVSWVLFNDRMRGLD